MIHLFLPKRLHLRTALHASITLLAIIPANAQDDVAAVRNWLQEHRAEMGLTGSDVASWVVTDRSISYASDTRFIDIQQVVNGLPVHNAVANFAVHKGHVVHVGNRLIADLAAKVPAPIPGMDAAQALRGTADQLGLSISGAVRTLRSLSATSFELSSSGISQDPIPAELIYQPVAGGGIALAWDLTIRSVTGRNWWHLAVDASTGRIIRTNDYIVECAVPNGSFGRQAHLNDGCEPRPPEVASPAPAPDGYRVFAVPVESPNHGDRSLVSDPADATASPFGWHDDDGVAGAEYTITRGNNAYASDDMDADNEAGYSPDGGPELEFDFALDLAQEPNAYLDASITNLFYWCNILHDVWYQYGFDEESGNFQATNYGGDGIGDDPVLADAQDGSGTDNANFGTPPDGENGRMQMYTWSGPEITTTLTVNDPATIAGEYVHELALFGPAPPPVPLTADMVLVI
ncbi:MAG: M36 family metallopeptidase, partial [Flavobacteriales bacterium]